MCLGCPILLARTSLAKLNAGEWPRCRTAGNMLYVVASIAIRQVSHLIGSRPPRSIYPGINIALSFEHAVVME